MFLRTLKFSRRMCRNSSTGTVDSKEMEHFKKFADTWWDATGPFRILHAMNTFRIPVIRDRLLASDLGKEKKSTDPNAVLKGFSILEAGCGAGVLAEPLAKIGSDVVGLDANPDLIRVAKSHSEKDKFLGQLQYVCSTIESYCEKSHEKFDAVVVSETIEHVTEKEQFMKSAIKCVKPGGLVFVSTNNKNFMSTFVNIFLAENILKIIPKDTHQSDKFISRQDLEKMLEKENCKTVFRRGMFYNPITRHWSLSKKFDFLWYIIQAEKARK